MNVAIITVGDELLAGTTTNTNAAWLASQLTDRGSTVTRILTIPDERDLIADYVARWHADDAFDAIIVTGGIGGTPDDVTVEGVADGLNRDLVVDDSIHDGLLEKAAIFREENPELVAEYDLEIDLEAAASLPAGAIPLVVEEAWAPGCVVDDVYVFAGIPDEMKAMFHAVEAEFDGTATARTIYTPAPEGALHDVLEGVSERFDVDVGSYPRGETRPGRIRVSGTEAAAVDDAIEWILERVETTDPGASTGEAND
ncbi:competence/damage-inducible protein A [Natronolimnobius baerhuensis]|uniref:Competence/damage-inducible protein A n=1 Tax=Natronolimnobius baerhuensis TaxID=253108 RepID=A0A202E7M5_9EURY|nr:molybdopterin-binding protein [Natronolimnobius baerhuensis]OVE84255.1 competence/damage-inducible protein A [Natronolimnobius baerhuensis]